MIHHWQPIKKKKKSPTLINPTKSPLDHPQLTKTIIHNPIKIQIKLGQPPPIHCDQPNQKPKPNLVNHRDQKPKPYQHCNPWTQKSDQGRDGFAVWVGGVGQWHGSAAWVRGVGRWRWASRWAGGGETLGRGESWERKVRVLRVEMGRQRGEMGWRHGELGEMEHKLEQTQNKEEMEDWARWVSAMRERENKWEGKRKKEENRRERKRKKR